MKQDFPLEAGRVDSRRVFVSRLSKERNGLRRRERSRVLSGKDSA